MRVASYLLVLVFTVATALLAQQAPEVKPAPPPAATITLAKPTARFIANFQKRALWLEVKADLQASLKSADARIKELNDALVVERDKECPGCGYDQIKNEFMPQPKVKNDGNQ